LKFLVLIIGFQLLLYPALAENINNEMSMLISLADTTIEESLEDSLINEVITAKTAPQQEKVQSLSQLTKYGFKNLFTSFNYNPALPYANQVNPNAELYMQDYLSRHKKSMMSMKSWATPYFNLIDNIFTQYGLPKELKYLAVIESSLQTGATSWVGAAGPWQFMPATARHYGLQVNKHVDERRDYFKSTHAAAHFLLKLYSDFHDWLLVIAAYNGGEERVKAAIKKSGSKDFWRLQYYLPEESRNHVKKFIATHYVMENNAIVIIDESKINRPEMKLAIDENLEKQMISGKFIGKIIAKNLSIDLSEFNKYNPQLDEQLSLTGSYELKLPKEKMKLFVSNKYLILNECIALLLSDNETPATTTVKPEPPATKKKRKS
jgi:membrane-bound lytic murein transglycosylase D